MTRSRVSVPLLLASAIALIGAAPASDSLLPGLWEEHSEMKVSVDGKEIPLNPSDAGGTERSCYTAKEVASPATMFMVGTEKECSVSNLKMTNGTMSMDVSCSMNGIQATGTATGTYAADRYSVTMAMHAKSPGQPDLEIRAMGTGRHLGQCSAVK